MYSTLPENQHLYNQYRKLSDNFIFTKRLVRIGEVRIYLLNLHVRFQFYRHALSHFAMY